MSTRSDYWTTERRREAEAKGHTFDGTRYPIETCEDVEDARDDLRFAAGGDAERSAIRAYIDRRASELHCPTAKRDDAGSARKNEHWYWRKAGAH